MNRLRKCRVTLTFFTMSAEKQPIVYPDFLAQRYEVLRELGQGAYGIVRYGGFM
jgi:hypothetical protein